MKRKTTIQLTITTDDTYASPDKWDWPSLLDLTGEDSVEVKVIVADEREN